MRHVDTLPALKGVNPRTDAIAFEKVPGGKMQRGLRQDQIELAVETGIAQAQDHRRHEASENTASQSYHQVGTRLLAACEIIALIVGEDPVTTRLEFRRPVVASRRMPWRHSEGRFLVSMARDPARCWHSVAPRVGTIRSRYQAGTTGQDAV